MRQYYTRTLDNTAREARIGIKDPVNGLNKAIVILRPVNLIKLEKLITAPRSRHSEQAKAALANYFVFGTNLT